MSNIPAYFAKIGSYLSFVMSIWGAAAVFLGTKYRNRQAKLVERYEQYKLENEVAPRKKGLFYYLSPTVWLSWCYQSKR